MITHRIKYIPTDQSFVEQYSKQLVDLGDAEITWHVLKHKPSVLTDDNAKKLTNILLSAAETPTPAILRVRTLQLLMRVCGLNELNEISSKYYSDELSYEECLGDLEKLNAGKATVFNKIKVISFRIEKSLLGKDATRVELSVFFKVRSTTEAEPRPVEPQAVGVAGGGGGGAKTNGVSHYLAL